MRMTNFKRVLRSGFVSFWRNSTVSVASMLVMTVTLFAIGSLILGGAIFDASLELIKNRVDINIYFKTDAKEVDIISLKQSLLSLPEVKEVSYVSREQALSDFRDKHKDNTVILSSLEELADNPLGASLSVRAKEPSQYEGIAKFLETDAALSEDGGTIVDKVNFFQNKRTIDRLALILSSAQTIGFAVTLLFILIAVAVIFNTIRLTIYIARDEISVMRLVGASNWYIRGPFVACGILYGIVSTFIVMAIFYPITIWVGNATANFFGGMNLYNYYTSNFFGLLAVLLATGTILGATGSYLAVRKYLKV